MLSRFVRHASFLCCLALSLSYDVAAQQPATGLPPLGSYAGGPVDTINLANLNIHLSIPIFSRAGRGIPLSYSLSYDSLVWMPVSVNGTSSWQPVSGNWGWRGITEAATGYVSYGAVTVNTQGCPYRSGGIQEYGAVITYYGLLTYHDPVGGIHPIAGSIVNYFALSGAPSQCEPSYVTPVTNQLLPDNSGYIVSTNPTTALGPVTVIARGGITLTTPPITSGAYGPGTVKDANGNTIQINYDSTHQITTIYDTLNSSTPALTITGIPPTNAPTCTNATGTSNVTYTYTAPSGAAATVTVSYTHSWVQTNYKVTNPTQINDFPVTPECFVNAVTYPDGTSYQFEYESTSGSGISGKFTGRLASVTVPTGGVITYSYAGASCSNESNCMMADGSPSAMQRGISGYQFGYTRGYQTSSSAPQQTATSVTDPFGNVTNLNFSSVYEEARTTYTGTSTLSDYRYTCYNWNYNNSTCPTTQINLATPIQWVSVDDQYDNNTTGAPSTSTQTYYDGTYGNVTGGEVWAFGGGMLQQTSTSYNTSLCSSKNICDHPSAVEIKNSGGTQVALTNYSYDGNGNTTQIQKWVTGTNYLTSSYSYNGNGTVATSIDPKGTQTTYCYAGLNCAGTLANSCQGSFPTSVSVPAGGSGNLTTSYTYNCNGGVVTSVTDPNGAITSTAYSDPHFWRPASTTDAQSNVTNFTYTPLSGSNNAHVESIMGPWNSGQSVTDNLVTLDLFGRIWLQQTNPGGTGGLWDTVQTTYLPTGQVFQKMPPYPSSPGEPSSGEPGEYWQYDGMGRVTDELNYYLPSFDIHYHYHLNDVTVTTNAGQFAGEQPKTRQYEYDADGRLTSVCEILSTGGSACGQQNGGSGYLTTYVYDPLNDLHTVTQGVQTRTFNYDGVGRLTSEINPESGTTSYTYDSVAANYCSSGSAYSSAGDLVAKADANTNHLCYYYDALHRLTDVGSNNQSSTNPCLRYRYDNSPGFGSIPSGVHPTDVLGRMVEAATDNCGAQGDPVLTDEWFSYSTRGQQTDLYASTPNSGGWYHTVNSYWNNGAVSGRVGYLGTGSTSFTNNLGYGVDYEGRPNGLWDANIGESIWWGTTNNSAGQPDIVDFYNGDSESFGWDANTGHMTSWTSKVGAKQQVGSLTWNSNGSLYMMQINDSVNLINTQSCMYGYDDLMRLSIDSCGANWAQTFSYDNWGNINKSGSVSFSSQGGTGNRVSNFSYDADGNVLNDTFNTYTYNAQGRPVTAGGATAVYDAFTRLVEIQSGGGNTQIVYAPDGFKFAYMNGQTVKRYLAPLGAGIQVVYTSGTGAAPAYWLHSDWLGSSRIASTTAQGMFGDQAYAPFGETYDSSGNALNVFTGQTGDMGVGAGTSPIYDFLFRQYSPTQGRWMVPDPAGLEAVDITNPQTWNRYAYVANNPLNTTDPAGLYKQSGPNLNIQFPTFCPGVFGCGSGYGGSFWGVNSTSEGNLFGNGGPDIDPNSNFDNAANEIEHFYGGDFSGTWNQQTMNSYEAQQFWQQQPASKLDPTATEPYPDHPDGEYQDRQFLTSLWGYLVQNQNPGAQSAYWQWQFVQGPPYNLGSRGGVGSGGPRFPAPFSTGIPDHYTFGPTKQFSNVFVCMQQHPNDVQLCIQSQGLL